MEVSRMSHSSGCIVEIFVLFLRYFRRVSAAGLAISVTFFVLSLTAEAAEAQARAPSEKRTSLVSRSNTKPLAATNLPPTADELFDWAERVFTGYFPGHQNSGTIDTFVYRYYPSTGNYLGVSGGVVYIFGPLSGNVLTAVGRAEDFTCQVSPLKCAALPTSSYSRIATTTLGACAIKLDASVWCWGAYPKFDGGTIGSPYEPTKIAGISDAVAIAAGTSHICILDSRGRVACWGANDHYQLGTGTDFSNQPPVFVAGVENAVDVVAGGYFTCALISGGQVKCWGEQYYFTDTLGNRSSLDYRIPTDIEELGDVVALSAYDYHACALRRSGNVACWGVRPVDSREPPPIGPGKVTAIAGLSGVKAVATGTYHTCAVQADSSVVCWGDDDNLSIDGQNSYTDLVITPIPVKGLKDVVSLYAGVNATCALRSNNSTVCWGQVGPSLIQLGVPDNVSLPPSEIAILGGFVSFPRRLDFFHSCGFRVDNALFCWGMNHAGQLGVRTQGIYSPPVQVPGF